MTGDQLARKLRERRHDLKVIWISGNGGPADSQDYLTKPFSREEMLKKIREVLEPDLTPVRFHRRAAPTVLAARCRLSGACAARRRRARAEPASIRRHSPATTTDAGALAILRRDGLLVPFASFDRDTLACHVAAAGLSGHGRARDSRGDPGGLVGHAHANQWRALPARWHRDVPGARRAVGLRRVLPAADWDPHFVSLGAAAAADAPSILFRRTAWQSAAACRSSRLRL